MPLLFLVLLLSSFSTYAQANLIENVSQSIQSVMDHSLNKGDMSVIVSRKPNQTPDIQCSLTYVSEKQERADCEVTFDVQSYYGDEQIYCKMNCELSYVFDSKNFLILTRFPLIERVCIETISYGCL